MNTATTAFDPIRLPYAALGWKIAHEHLIASFIDYDDYQFMILHSGHRIYGYTSEAAWINTQSPEVYPEELSPEYWAEDFADKPKWVAAIKDIPALYAYHLDFLKNGRQCI